jgi:dTDP-4-amino-4,6-dideoxygalactose transaminase
MIIPFSPPLVDEDVIKEVTETLRSGWITTGPKTKQLEKLIAAYVNVQQVLCLNSATAGMELLLRWFGVKEGDEVIVPAYTYAATANVVVHCGAKPVIVDVNENDFNINLEKIKIAITSKTKAIIPVDFAGFPCDYDEMKKMVEEKKNIFLPQHENQKKLGRIMILSDAAHSLGAHYKNMRTGKCVDATVFSFHAVKNLTTAEGGALCLNFPETFDNAHIYNTLNISSLHGQNKDAFAKTKKGAWEYDIIEAGFKCNLADIAAAIGLAQFRNYESKIIPQRKKIFESYKNYFEKKDWAIIPTYETTDKKSSYHIFPLRIKNISVEQRNEIIQKIFDKDVSVNVHFKPLPLLSFYKNYGYDINNFPSAKTLYENEISLPVYFDLTEEMQQTVIDAVVKSVEEII